MKMESQLKCLKELLENRTERMVSENVVSNGYVEKQIGIMKKEDEHIMKYVESIEKRVKDLEFEIL